MFEGYVNLTTVIVWAGMIITALLGVHLAIRYNEHENAKLLLEQIIEDYESREKEKQS